MRPNRRIASVLMAVALTATALLGAAGTTWYEALSASTTVTTTSLDATVVCSSLSETDPNNSITPGSSANGPYSWVLSIASAYPGYALTCNYTLTNNAPVPWHIETLTVVVTDPAAATTSATCTLGASCTYTGTFFNLSLPDDRGCQVHQAPTSPSTRTGAFTLTFTNAPATAGTWGVKVTYGVNQFNESIYRTCGVLRP